MGAQERRESGQALPFVLVVVVAVAFGAWVLGTVGAAVVASAQARTAADAAALAGARHGRAAAEWYARANGARLVRFASVAPVRTVEVVVAVDVLGRDAQAVARAGLGLAGDGP